MASLSILGIGTVLGNFLDGGPKEYWLEWRKSRGFILHMHDIHALANSIRIKLYMDPMPHPKDINIRAALAEDKK